MIAVRQSFCKERQCIKGQTFFCVRLHLDYNCCHDDAFGTAAENG